MRKYSLKRLLPWSIVIWVFAVLAIVGFMLMPLIDGMVKGVATRFDQFTWVDAGLVGVFKELFAFEGKRTIIAFAAFVLAIAIMVAWFIVILVRKHYKKLIFWGINLVCVVAFVICATLIFSGTKGESFSVRGNWIFDIAFAEKFKYPGEKCLIGGIIGIAIGALGALGLVIMGISFIIDLVPEKEKKSEEAEIEEALQKRLGQSDLSSSLAQTSVKSTVSDEKIRQIVHDECEILYLRLLRNKTFSLENNKEEKVVVKEEHVARDPRATDDAYYERMISELGMFKDKRVQSVEQPTESVQKVVPVQRVVPAPKAKVVVAPTNKIIRIPFEKRIVVADKVMKDHFNDLKSEILSYGVKSRVSNSGDTFRLHTVTYVKVTIAGKSLKLYLALNPKDYKDSTLPIADASKKAIYKEIPLVFKVKSELSLRRAKQLIADAMAKGGLKQGEVVAHDWVKEIKNGNF